MDQPSKTKSEMPLVKWLSVVQILLIYMDKWLFLHSWTLLTRVVVGIEKAHILAIKIKIWKPPFFMRM